MLRPQAPYPPDVASGDRRGAARSESNYVMTAEDLRRITERCLRSYGIELGEQKRQMVYSRLSRRLRALGVPNFTAYLAFLDSPAGSGEIELFGNCLTTNLTAFFREAHHFTHFETEIRKTPPADRAQRLRIWSAGCSTGEEAYTQAMILRANAGVLAGRDHKILATDIDTEVLRFASRGIYAPDRVQTLPPRFAVPDYITAHRDGVSITEPVRSLITFRMLNLIGPWPFRGAFDVIFCRNVLIYFSGETKSRLIDQMAALLRPGGILYLGHSESILGTHPQLTAEGHTTYRRGPQ